MRSQTIFVIASMGTDKIAPGTPHADSDQFARLFRSDLAQDSDFKSLTIPISNRPRFRNEIAHHSELMSPTIPI